MLYAYQTIGEMPAVYSREQRAAAYECLKLVTRIEENGADIAVQDEDLRFYSLLRRARDLEARLAYETFLGFVPLLPELFEITPDELATMDENFQRQFMGIGD